MAMTGSAHSAPKPRLNLGQGHEEKLVRDVWNAFTTWMRDDKNYAFTTRKGYLYRCEAAHRWLRNNGHKGLPWATEETLRLYWNTVPPAAETRRYVRSALLAFFHFINAQGWRPDNPAQKLPSPSVPRRLPRPVSNTDVEKLLDVAEAMGPMVAAMVNVFAYTGIRNAELRGLRWADLEGPWLRVIGKGNKERSVPIPPPAMVALVRWRNHCSAPEWIFPATRNEDRQMAPQTLNYIIQELADIACVKVTPHMLRHTYATQMMEVSEGDLRLVQEALGHSKPETTAIYTKVQPKRIADVADQLAY